MLKHKKLQDNKDELVHYGKRFSSNEESIRACARACVLLSLSFLLLLISTLITVVFILYSSHRPKYSIGKQHYYHSIMLKLL